MTDALFAADSIGRRFGSRQVLQSASVRACRGSISVVFGRNGSGKSTLLRAAVGLVRMDYGTVFFDGAVSLRPRLHKLANAGLFYMPERDLLSRRWTVSQHLRAIRWRYGHAIDDAMLRKLGIADVVHRRTGELSGGEVRRAEVAIAFHRRPTCLLADEPLAGISPREADLVAETLRSLASQGCAIVVTGHEVPALMQIADRVVWMVGGTTHELGSPAAALRSDQFRREYLGPGFRL